MLEWLWVKGKVNRKYYFLNIALGILLIWTLFNFFGVVEYHLVEYIIPLLTEDEAVSLFSVVFGIAFLLLFMISWFLFCNKVRRVHDIGYGTKWAILIEAVRYGYVAQIVTNEQFLNENVQMELSGDFMFFVLGVPIIIGLIKGKVGE